MITGNVGKLLRILINFTSPVLKFINTFEIWQKQIRSGIS